MEEAEIKLMQAQIRRDTIEEVRRSMLETAAEIVCPNCYHKMHIMLITNLVD